MANTQKNVKFYICTTPQPTDLDRAGFEALTWVLVGRVGSKGESGTQTNMVSYDTLDTEVTQKAKGVSNAGDPTIECARVHNDPGQIAMRAAAETDFNYAFKTERNDAPSPGMTNTVIYERGKVAGPTRPNGRVEDFDLEVFTLGLNQREVVVNPEAIGS